MDEGRRRVVITGLGPITASGIGVEPLWQGLRTCRSPVGPVTRFDAGEFRTRIAAEVGGFDATNYMDRQRARRLDLYGQFALASGRMALTDAGLDPADVDPARAAIQMGSALGGIAYAQDQLAKYYTRGLKSVDARVATTTYVGAASCQMAIEFGFTGPNSTNGMSCASGALAVAEGFRLIRDGEADVALAGGIEAPLAILSFGAFALIRAMSQRNEAPSEACRPFDRDRDGFVMGEGACVLVLEEEGHARARGAVPYAEVRGYGVTSDAYHMTAPRPQGTQAIEAMRRAVKSAGLEPDAIDHVNAHASSTPLNDGTESRALRAFLGRHADSVSVTGTKPYHGHALGASGAIELAISCLAMRRGWIPPTLNLHQPGDDCDLDYVRGTGRDEAPKMVLSNSFGFGGINASVLISAPRSPRAVTA